jgi:deoxyribodipyrimidine photo-lyase
VWLKRDLRLMDHAPLDAASHLGPSAALWILEPQWLESPEFHPRQLAFAQACVTELRTALAARGLPLLVRVGPAVQVLQELHAAHGFDQLLSHEETGPGWTYARDLAVAAWCRERGVGWTEWPQHGVVRRLKSRSGWAGRWAQRMNAQQVTAPSAWSGWTGVQAGELPAPEAALGSESAPGSPSPADTLSPVPGERAGLHLLDDFLVGRGRGYRRALSSPLTAEAGCSRISAHLAFGALSVRMVHQRTEAAMAAAQAQADRALASGLRGFAGRLRWHCHFMQKLESEPAIEFRHFARACDGLRPGDDAPGSPAWGVTQDSRLRAWQLGQTGFPMVDACMRSLNATGWLNFRMRAMLVSFAAYHLWLHWRPTGLHLARQFTDFEAGIHWSQMQMQSGTTGINTLRIYSPSKQALDQDPQGDFIRRWVPELAQVPLAWLHRPWTMDATLQRESGCVIDTHYPAPIVDEQAAARAAKDAMFGLRKGHAARAEADRIQDRHGSRKSGLPQTGLGRRRASPPLRSGAPDTQLDLFGMADVPPCGDEQR